MAVNVVVGAGGNTGVEVVKRLLEATDAPVRAVMRNPDRASIKLPKNERLSVVAGDVTNADSLTSCLQDAKGVVITASGSGFFTAKAVDNKGVENVAHAAKSAGVQRVVLVSSMLAHPSNRFNPIRIILNNIKWGLIDNKYAGEEKLRASGVPFTIVRPGGLNNNAAGVTKIITEFDNEKEGGGSISRADVAAVCVQALTDPKAKNATISIYTKGAKLEGDADTQLKTLFDHASQTAS